LFLALSELVPLKKLVLATWIGAFAVSGASAADLATDQPLPAPPNEPYVYDWSGFYVGAHAGWSGSTVDTTDLDGVTAPFPDFVVGDIDFHGFSGGVLAGYDWQIGNLVLGVEADWASGGDGDSTFDIVENDEYLEWDTEWTATARARLGWAFDNLLLYGTGGGAWADIGKFGYTDRDEPLDFQSDETLHGWVLGGGVGWGITPNVIVRAEYLHYDFDTVDLPLLYPDDIGPIRYDLTMDTVRAALIWKF
jgi:outer membrane immunogenic protein